MNSTTNTVLGSGAIVILGRWKSGHPMDVKVVVGVVFLAVIISVLPDQVAGPMAGLILVTVLFTYGPDLLSAVGAKS